MASGRLLGGGKTDLSFRRLTAESDANGQAAAAGKCPMLSLSTELLISCLFKADGRTLGHLKCAAKSFDELCEAAAEMHVCHLPAEQQQLAPRRPNESWTKLLYDLDRLSDPIAFTKMASCYSRKHTALSSGGVYSTDEISASTIVTTTQPYQWCFAIAGAPMRAGVHYAEVTVTGTRDSPDAGFMFGVGPKGMDVDKMPFAQSMPFWGLLSADGSCHYQRGGPQPTVPEMWRWKGRRRKSERTELPSRPRASGYLGTMWPLVPGTALGLQLDFNQHTLTVYIDGDRRGICAVNVGNSTSKFEYVWVLSLLAEGATASIRRQPVPKMTPIQCRREAKQMLQQQRRQAPKITPSNLGPVHKGNHILSSMQPGACDPVRTYIYMCAWVRGSLSRARALSLSCSDFDPAVAIRWA